VVGLLVCCHQRSTCVGLLLAVAQTIAGVFMALLVLGIAGSDQSLDKILFLLVPNMEVGDEQLGIYAAVSSWGW
jgi:hypothetical protein